MPPIASKAAVALAAKHPKVDLDMLLRTCTEPFLSVTAVRAELHRLEREAERLRKIAAAPTMKHQELRNELRAAGIRNSFEGCSVPQMRAILLAELIQDHDDPSDANHDAVPQQLNHVARLRKLREQQYEALLGGVTLHQLAGCLPTARWEHYCANGWLKINLRLGKKERRMIALCHRVALCELGVDPTNRATFQNAKHVLGYDANWGWLRTPANSSAQLYLAAHPRLYRMRAGRGFDPIPRPLGPCPWVPSALACHESKDRPIEPCFRTQTSACTRISSCDACE